MPTIFISYRRDDTQYVAQQIRDRLARAFGTKTVIFDIDSKLLGDDFPAAIRAQVGRCDWY